MNLAGIRENMDKEVSKLDKLTNDYLLFFKTQYFGYKRKNISHNPRDILFLLQADDWNLTDRNLLIDKKIINSLEKSIRNIKKTDVYIKEIQNIIDKHKTNRSLHQLLTASYHGFKHKLDAKTQEIMKPHLYDFETMKNVTKTNRTKKNVTQKAKSY